MMKESVFHAENEEPSMISTIKKIVASGLMLLGLTGLVDNAVEWHGFFKMIVSEYQVIRDYIFDWLPFDVSVFVKNYLVIGTGLASSFLRMRQEVGLFSVEKEVVKGKFWELALFWIINCLTWPVLAFVASLYLFIEMFIDPPQNLKAAKGLHNIKVFRRKLAEVAVIFIGILFVFSDALSKFGSP